MNMDLASRIWEIREISEKYRKLLNETADKIWEYHEIAYEEHQSSGVLKQILVQNGFSVEVPCKELPTAFLASYGSGKPIIGLLGEYDALPGMSQEADTVYQKRKEGEAIDAPGHGCGHNLLGTGLLGAALCLKEIIEQQKLPGTIIYFGCPAEENASGKSKMVEKGFFDSIDAAFSWHPHNQSGIFNQSLANQRVVYSFHGVSAHASQAPELGRSALDACELMNIGVNYMREHMIDEARIHYAYLNSGGTLPNIIPSKAELLYAIRAPKGAEAQKLRERTDRIAKGAALMTDTSVEIQTKCIYDSLLANTTLDSLILKYLSVFTPIEYNEEEIEYARGFVPFGNQPQAMEAICKKPDLSATRKTGISTDVGNVSQMVPCSSFMVNCYASGSPLHHWTVTAQGKSELAHKGMITAVQILTATVWELLEKPQLIEQAHRDFENEKRKQE